MKLADAATEFLASKRIAVTGVSRNPQGHGSNAVIERLIERGYDAIPINPNATELAGVTAYPNLAAVPGGVDAVVIGTRPEHALDTVKEAVELGIDKVWMHRSIDAGSVSADAVAYGRDHGVVAHITRDRQPTDFLRYGLGALVLHISHHDFCPLRRKRAGRCSTDTRRAAGDEHHPISEFRHRGTPWERREGDT